MPKDKNSAKGFGKGAVKMPLAMAASRYQLAAPEAFPLPVWKPFSDKNIFKFSKIFDQDGSLSCTSQGTSYFLIKLLKILHNIDFEPSRRFIYSQVFLPTGGAYIADAMGIPIAGIATEVSVPEGDSSETIMRDKSLNNNADIEAQALKYAVTPEMMNIDSLASVIDAFHGVVSGFQGVDTIFQTIAGKPGVADVVPTNPTWAHCVFLNDYGLLPNGQKAIIFVNSWGAGWGDSGYGYFTDNFVKNGGLFDSYTFADALKIAMRYIINSKLDQYLIHDALKMALKIGDEQELAVFKANGLVGDPSPAEVPVDFTVYSGTRSSRFGHLLGLN